MSNSAGGQVQTLVDKAVQHANAVLHEVAPNLPPVEAPDLGNLINASVPNPLPTWPSGDQFHFAGVIQDFVHAIVDAPPNPEQIHLAVQSFVHDLHEALDAKFDTCHVDAIVNNIMHETGGWPFDQHHTPGWLVT
jgi:hypothetical protein